MYWVFIQNYYYIVHTILLFAVLKIIRQEVSYNFIQEQLFIAYTCTVKPVYGNQDNLSFIEKLLGPVDFDIFFNTSFPE